MSITLDYVSKLGRVKRVSCIMMEDRGYELPPEEKEILSMTDLCVGAKYLSTALKAKCPLSIALSSTYGKEDDSCLVLFLDNNYDENKKREKMVSTDQAKAAILLWKSNFSSCEKCIFVCPGKLSPDAKKEVQVPNLSLLTHEFLILPVGRHVMVPSHIPLTEKDAEVFLRSRKLERKQLPQLKTSDPVSLYYGFVPNTIVKIQRPGWTIFRIVVE